MPAEQTESNRCVVPSLGGKTTGYWPRKLRARIEAFLDEAKRRAEILVLSEV
jgi:hypothetical protein